MMRLWKERKNERKKIVMTESEKYDIEEIKEERVIRKKERKKDIIV